MKLHQQAHLLIHLLTSSFPALFRCRTIALETGFQNSQLCSTIVQLSFSPDELEVMFAFPLIYSIFQLVVAVITVGGENLAGRYVAIIIIGNCLEKSQTLFTQIPTNKTNKLM